MNAGGNMGIKMFFLKEMTKESESDNSLSEDSDESDSESQSGGD